MRPSSYLDYCIKHPGPLGSCAAEVMFKAIEIGISVGKFPIFQVSQVLNLGQVDQDL